MGQLAVLSGKGGTGKTTVAAALIRLFDCKGFADCDVDAPNLHLISGTYTADTFENYYGYDKAVIDPNRCLQCGACQRYCRFDAIADYTVNPYACEGCGVCEAVCPACGPDGIKAVVLVPRITGETRVSVGDATVFSSAELEMGSGASGKLVNQVRKNLHQRAFKDQLLIIDGSPGIGCPVIASITGVDWVLVVTEPTVSGIHDMARIVDTGVKFGSKVCVCVNKYDIHLAKTKQIIDYCENGGIPMVGLIPFDPMAIDAVNTGISVVEMPESQAGKAIRRMSGLLVSLMQKV